MILGSCADRQFQFAGESCWMIPLLLSSQPMFCQCLAAPAAAAVVPGGRGRPGPGPSGRVAPGAPADSRHHQADGGTVPLQKEHHGQPVQT